ncbi:BatA domain-containing protein [Variovorax sp. Sphag1AA]|uniref:BatA domain-containing protein n=1 Tax=Variovorax sp. Sphag1AA TaxID=2587027 RepID=UPI00182669FF|nr:BatA domain-containing protein [Variovorax sp. Sphag1AA]MBB3178720.1 hypothetical protein [Variovorax sp. Sphag1AA]
MFFLWPDVFWLLMLLPLLPVAYVWLLRRRSKAALRFSSLSLVRGAARHSWRRHLPPALFLLALVGLIFAAAVRWLACRCRGCAPR